MQTEDINKPTPTIESNETKIELKSKIKEPANGTLNPNITIDVIIVVKHIAIINGGIVFPSKISKDESGLTISWSKVPISLSLAIDNAVKINETTTDNIARIIVKIYHLYSRFGLNQFLTIRFILALFTFRRENIFSYSDVALRNGIMKAKGYKTLSQKRFNSLKKRYSPYCSYASLYFYAHNDNELRWK